MKLTQITPLGLTTLTGYILGAIAITLIALPMGVFAQSEEEPTEAAEAETIETTLEEGEGNATTTEEVVEAPPVDPYFDTYKREKLPASNRVFNDFVIGPGRFALEIAPGESKTVMLNVSNRLGGERLFRFTTEDISAGDNESQTTQLLGDTIGPYTIKDYISVPYERFYVENNTRAIVPVTVTIPPDAEPGGFYGAILTEVLPESRDQADSDVAPATALVSRIGTLFYVTTPGEIEREGSLVGLSTVPDKSVYFEGPIDIGITFENTGSVHLTPYGNVSVQNILGDTVGQVELDPWYVMPKSVRTREISWDREFLFGRYTITADIERGYGNEVDSMAISFWVFPWKFMAAVFGGIFLFFLIIRFIFRNVEIKRKK